MRRSVVASAALGAALTPLNSTMVAVALPALAADFDAPAATVTVLVVTGYLVATLVAQMPAGNIADRIGYARALTIGRWMFCAGAIVGTLAPSLNIVVAGRLLMAMGGALINPTAMALLRTGVPAERRSRAFGTMGAVMGGAAALGPAIGAWTVAQASWRWLFVINLPLLLLSWTLQPPVATDARAAARASRFDWQGSVLVGAALMLITVATRVAAPLAYALAAAGVVLAGVLIAHERREPDPVVKLPLFTERGFITGAGVIGLQNLAMYSLLIQVPFMFGGGRGDSRLGMAMTAMAATMAIMSPVGGRLVERLGVKAVVTAGGLIAALGVIGLMPLPAMPSAMDVGSRLMLVGLGLGLATGPANAAALSAVAAHQSAAASATVSMLRYLGAIAGTVVLSFAFSGSGRQQIALWIFAGALLASAALGLMLRSLPTRRG